MNGHNFHGLRSVFRRIMCVCLAAVLALPLSSCAGEESGTAYVIYYLGEDKNSYEEEIVYIDETDPEEIANTIIEEMDTSEDGSGSVIKPSNVTAPSVEIEGIYANVDFDSSYYSMKLQTEVMYRAAVVRELCQIKGVSYVRFYVDGEEAAYSDGTGEKYGSMSSNDFVDSSNSSIADVKWVTISLYYANKTGDALVRTRRKLCYNKNISIEKVVVEQLISGPDESGCYRSVPESSKILSISVVDKICYVNFSEEFATDMVNAKSNVSIYSVVNSLTGLTGIDGVKILVNGNSNLMYRDIISLDTVFTMNSDIIEK